MSSPSRALTTSLVVLGLLSTLPSAHAAEFWTNIEAPSYRIPAPAMVDGAFVDITYDFDILQWNGSGWDPIFVDAKREDIPTPPYDGGSSPTAACGVGSELYVSANMRVSGGTSIYKELHHFSASGASLLYWANCYDFATGCAAADDLFDLQGKLFVGRGPSVNTSVWSFDGFERQYFPQLNNWESPYWDCEWQGMLDVPCNLAARVWAMGVLDDELYAAGDFGWSEGNSVYVLVRLRGGTWSNVGLPPGVKVWSMVSYDGMLVVAGSFPAPAGTQSSNIALFDGTNWHGLGQGIEGRVDVMTVHDGQLFVGGVIRGAGGQPAGNIAVWDGTAWRIPPTLPGEKTTHLFSTMHGLMAVTESVIDLNWRRFLYRLDGSVPTQSSSWGTLKARTRGQGSK